MRPAQATALAATAGLAHGLAFPPTGWWPLAFVALAPLVAVGRTATPRRAAAYGALAGLLATSVAGTPALTVAGRDYFGLGPLAAVAFGTALGVVYHVVPTALFGATLPLVARLRGLPVRALAAGATWAGLEHLRALPPYGSAWDLLAHALYAHPLCFQLADLGGPSLVSGVVVAIAAALAEGVRRPRASAATAGALLVLMLGYGAWRLAGERDGSPTIPVALVQGAVPSAWRNDPARADDAYRALADATAPLLGQRPALVVWPENAFSVLLGPNARFTAALAALLGEGGPPLVVGGPRTDSGTPGRARFFNAAYLLSSRGDTLAIYDKRRLVPFAEYAPLATVPLLGWRLDRPGDYSAGVDATVFREPVPFGVLICFETIYPDLARDLVRAGATLLVSISNDAWFGHSAGPEQHFAMGVFRAVETRRALVRVTNTGVTALVGPSGRIVARFPTDVRGGEVVRAPVRDGTTPFTRWGDLLPWVCVGLGLAAVVRGWGISPTRG